MNLLHNFNQYKISAASRWSLLLNKAKYKKNLLPYKYAFQNKYGLEIGGPTPFFAKDILPVYEWASCIDGCNFSSNTMWEGAIQSSDYQYISNKTGHQYILDGTDLKGIKDSKYDFLLSSHNLEHIANPLKAIQEWKRVIKPGGFILLILPDKRFTFDRKRAYTAFEHLLSDFKLEVKEDDLTHLPEILQLHDLSLDNGVGRDYNAFKKRSEENGNYRGMHHHVFSQQLLKDSLEYFNIEVQTQFFVPPFHQIIIGKKS